MDTERHIWWWIFIYLFIFYLQHCPLLKGSNVHLRFFSYNSIPFSTEFSRMPATKNSSGVRLERSCSTNKRIHWTNRMKSNIMLTTQNVAPHLWHWAINQPRVCKIQFATARAQCITIDNLMEAWSKCELLGATRFCFFAEVMCEAISRDPRYVCELWQDVNEHPGLRS